LTITLSGTRNLQHQPLDCYGSSIGVDCQPRIDDPFD
jgi:hypothetical protein